MQMNYHYRSNYVAVKQSIDELITNISVKVSISVSRGSYSCLLLTKQNQISLYFFRRQTEWFSIINCYSENIESVR